MVRETRICGWCREEFVALAKGRAHLPKTCKPACRQALKGWTNGQRRNRRLGGGKMTLEGKLMALWIAVRKKKGGKW